MNNAERLDPENLERLRNISTPTIANAIERLKIRRNDEGYTDATIRCFFPELGPIAGYACTAVIRSREPYPQAKYRSRRPYWEYILQSPAPRVAVVQDLDQPPAGAFFGEVNSNIHRRLGCVGVITDGTVRDLGLR
ncbi:MAG: RraA family protein, partial [Acidobacteria bacterium]|nr:RraA family protein [Acidobacteriota bacterium]